MLISRASCGRRNVACDEEDNYNDITDQQVNSYVISSASGSSFVTPEAPSMCCKGEQTRRWQHQWLQVKPQG
ncbi:hypothetical protein RRG08_004374 [Elysia crispata]|uniref:Uncharacterized protein n=1 Tax=Elysia crispata TaxID=231223 RepID=A0AAE1DBN7_9GAST|nr:hypothetical protein RRG08_004374 [Elysia crispata]